VVAGRPESLLLVEPFVSDGFEGFSRLIDGLGDFSAACLRRMRSFPDQCARVILYKGWLFVKTV
jgi:hypothetical protein